MSGYKALLKREIRYLRYDRTSRLLQVWLPLAAMLFFVVLFGDGVIRSISVAVIDEDHTDLSRAFEQELDFSKRLQIEADYTTFVAAERGIREGRISAVIVIPDQFAAHLIQGRRATIFTAISGTNLSTEGQVSAVVEEAADAFTSKWQLQRFEENGIQPPATQPTLCPICIRSHTLFNPSLNYGTYLAPVFLPMMLIILTSMATIYAVGRELKYGTSDEWLAGADCRLSKALICKMAPIIVSGMVMVILMIILWHYIMAIPIHGSLFWLLCSSWLLLAAYQSIGVMLVAITGNMRLALSLGGGYAVLAFTFSGMTFPAIAMWQPFRVLSNLFPFTHYMEIVVDQLLRGAPVRYSFSATCSLLSFVLLPWVTIPRLKSILTDPKYRGRL